MQVRGRERDDAEKAYTKRVGTAFVEAEGAKSLLEVFAPRSVPRDEVARFVAGGAASFAAAGAGKVTRSAVDDAAARGIAMPSAADLPTAFSRGGDRGVIRSSKAAARSPFETAGDIAPLYMLSHAACA